MSDKEKSVDKALVLSEEKHPVPSKPSPLERIGIGKTPGKAGPWLRAILAGLQQMGSEQIKQIPVLGPLLSGAGAALLQLSSEEDDAQLEEKVSQILVTGEQSRETLEALSALAAAIYLQQETLIVRLQEAGVSADRKQIEAVALSTALAAFRGKVARHYQYADHRGIEGGTRQEHAASLPLDEVYVTPLLIAEQSQADKRARERLLLKKLLDNEDLIPKERTQLEEEFALLTGEQWRAGQQEGQEGEPIAQILSKTRQAVVIGGPGLGKSAMTRYLARTCALGADTIRERLGWDEELTPIVLPLAGYADARSRKPGLSLRQYLDGILTERGGEALRLAIDQELHAGQVFLLLDGVDEIPDSRERLLIVKAVEHFLFDHTSNRFLVTSRPYGYVRLAGDIAHFQLLNFSPDQVRDFLFRWQRAFERWRHPQAPDYRAAEEEAKRTLEEISRNPKVTELATNPLILVILALIRHEQARLPEERVQLYNRAVNTLMDTWNRGRSLAGIDVGGVKLPLDRLVRVWGSIAEWTRREKPTGVVHRAELQRKLVEILIEEELDEDNPEATAESYLNAAADRAGLLEERGKDIFAFWHPTFEEFLAAVELATPSSKAIERILPLRDDPRWREVILLAVGYLGVVQRDRETATALVEAIWLRDPGALEPLLHSHLRLAAACVADDVGIKRSLAERILQSLSEVVQQQPYDPFLSTFVQTVRALPRLRPSRMMIAALAPLVKDPRWEVRMEAVRLLSNAASEDSKALELCERMLRDGDPDVRCHAALGLARAGQSRPEVWSSLSNYQSPSAQIKRAVREYLDENVTEVRDRLAPLLTGSDERLRYQAAQLLSGMGGDPEGVLKALEPWLTGSDEGLRYQAARSLLRMGGDPERVLKALEPLLTGSDEVFRYEAAWLLSMMGGESDRVLKALEPWLTGSDKGLRYQAAQLLSRMGGESDRVLKALEPLLTGSDEVLRYQAARLLSGMGGEPEERALKALEPLLTGSNEPLRYQAARLLSRMGGEPERVQKALEPLLTGSDQPLRYQAALLLLDRKEMERVGLETLVELANSASQPFLAACGKVFNSLPLSDTDGTALSDFVRPRPEDTGDQKAAKESLFNWLSKKLGSFTPIQ